MTFPSDSTMPDMEKTEVIYGEENSVKAWHDFSVVKER
jgi:hypothetical protein